jgi:hypothetical protein
LPVWAAYILIVLILVLALEAGFWLGKYIQKRWPDNYEPGVGAIMGLILSVVMLLILALDRSYQELIKDSQDALISLQRSLNGSP